MNNRYFNNAGAGLMSEQTMQVINEHMKLEREMGAYKAAIQKSDDVSNFYDLAAEILNADSKDEIAYVDSASRGWNLVMYGIDIKKEDVIVTLSSEYGTNLLTIYDIANKVQCGVKIIQCDSKGNVILDDIEEALKAGGTILAISHVAAQGSIVNPVEQIGKIADKYHVLYIVDGCQAVGQMRVDVQKIGCNAYITAGRKWLRGPRGTGILYVKKESPINTPQIDLASSDLVFDEYGNVKEVTIRKDAKQFELWEKNIASVLGLRNALKEYIEYGIDKASKEVIFKANKIRNVIYNNSNLLIVGNDISTTGVAAFYMKKPEREQEIKDILEKHNIIISYICDWDCPIYFPKNGAKIIFRFSPHYYTNDEDVEMVCNIIKEI